MFKKVWQWLAGVPTKPAPQVEAPYKVEAPVVEKAESIPTGVTPVQLNNPDGAGWPFPTARPEAPKAKPQTKKRTFVKREQPAAAKPVAAKTPAEPTTKAKAAAITASKSKPKSKKK